MGKNDQNSNTLGPPPKSPDCTAPSVEKSSPTTSYTSPTIQTSDSSSSSIDLRLKNYGTNPNAIETPTSDSNLDIGPPPMNSKGPTTPGGFSQCPILPKLQPGKTSNPKLILQLIMIHTSNSYTYWDLEFPWNVESLTKILQKFKVGRARYSTKRK